MALLFLSALCKHASAFDVAFLPIVVCNPQCYMDEMDSCPLCLEPHLLQFNKSTHSFTGARSRPREKGKKKK
ncbi:hypothetical protein B0T19DRAFT_429761, partial [Cercophora scortea]